MYKQCTTEKTITQQRAVKSCLLKLMQTQPYDKITVTALCQQAGITRRIFYRLFDTKDDVLYALIDHTLLRFPALPIAANREPDVVRAAIRESLLFWQMQKPLLDALEKNAAIGLLMERTISHIAYNDLETLRSLGAENDPNKMYIVRFCILGIMGLVVQWHNSNYEKSIEEMITIEYQLLTSAHIPLVFSPHTECIQ